MHGLPRHSLLSSGEIAHVELGCWKEHAEADWFVEDTGFGSRPLHADRGETDRGSPVGTGCREPGSSEFCTRIHRTLERFTLIRAGTETARSCEGSRLHNAEPAHRQADSEVQWFTIGPGQTEETRNQGSHSAEPVQPRAGPARAGIVVG